MRNLLKCVLKGMWILMFSVTALFSASDLSKINVFPNPVRHYLGQTQVNFSNVTSQVRIRIYNIRGSLVRDIELGNAGNSVQWNLKNQSGQEVASGIYIYRIEAKGTESKQYILTKKMMLLK